MSTLLNILNLNNPTNYTTANIVELLNVTEDEIVNILKSLAIPKEKIEEKLTYAAGDKEALANLLELSINKYELSKKMVRKRLRELMRPWNPDEFILGKIPPWYRELSMDYGKMEKLPEKTEFIFDISGRYFEQLFGLDCNPDKIFENILPNQPNEELTSIVLGKSSDSLVYIAIFSGNKKMPGRVKNLNGNENINNPIYHGCIPYENGSLMKEKFDGHIELLIPNNLIPKK